jgi:hypothetical protein
MGLFGSMMYRFTLRLQQARLFIHPRFGSHQDFLVTLGTVWGLPAMKRSHLEMLLEVYLPTTNPYLPTPQQRRATNLQEERPNLP